MYVLGMYVFRVFYVLGNYRMVEAFYTKLICGVARVYVIADSHDRLRVTNVRHREP